MAVEFIFHRLAAKEYREARRWYADQSVERANRFISAVDYTIGRMTRDPDSFEVEITDVRRIRVSRYPYNIFFQRIDERIALIVALAHTSRRPRYWRRRI